MPLKDWNLKSTYDSAYSIRAERFHGGHPSTRPEIRLSYHRTALLPWCASRAANFKRILNLQPTQNILIVGAGYGWTAECLINEQGIPNILVTDTSAYIQSTKDQSGLSEINDAIRKVGIDPDSPEGIRISTKLNTGIRSRIPIINESALTDDSILRIRSLMNPIHLILTEDVLDSLTDLEAIHLSTQLHKLSNNIVHFILDGTNSTDRTYNWKTSEEWKLLLPLDSFILNSQLLGV